MARVDKTIHLMECIKNLQDPQSELLLLRNCAGVSKLYFAMRTTKPQFLQAAQVRFDQFLLQFLRYLVTGDGPGFGPIQQRIATLPIRDGGLGVYTMADTVPYCYLASIFQTKYLQDTILRSTFDFSPHFQIALENYMEVCGLSSSTFNIKDTAPQPMHFLAVRFFDVVKRTISNTFNLSERDSILWQCNRQAHAQDYLKVFPIPGLNQVVGPRQFRSVLQYRLGIPIFEGVSSCSCCHRITDRFGDHAIHYASEVGQKFRHDMVRDLFVDLCYKVGVAARKEAALGFSSDTKSSLKPADILVYNWKNCKDMCFDVTNVSPFSKGGNRSFTPDHAISAAITRKRNKYVDICSSSGYGFGVLVFSTLGELGDDVVVLLKRLKNCMSSHDGNSSLGSFLISRLGIIIQKGVGAQIVARLLARSV
ncbi:uncharacterized protein LOC113345800 [Papaver somniferum]|uniref:uncharacterized protein LOC113345800 n=1 Tax=Papaver somniferum TaxID=3469 RepID=UPI000E6F8B0A|nr:uncharacterized protein LOC113345800 [Papaver somniferum]XP_026445254.1 uncharacterized protein LOC113345800 [Papaver somniferum]XP_026445255.1 uncharacterized protein LOC113345800 [Papaver somniferum]XP_026445256.1 uncharacterized protein LOC113345800 [Papaver somniferum]XP_026445257.1 uncharacterized protein LOC113345800 [Papaver somniferum]